MLVNGVKTIDGAPSGSSGLPRKKLVLAVLLVLTAAVFLLVSFYMNDQVSTVTLSGRQWVSRMLVSPQRENLSLSTDDSAYVNHSLTSGISVAKNLSVITARNSPSASVADFAVGGNAASIEQSKRPPLGPGQTYVTFDNSTVIQCPMNTPYVLCNGIPTPRTSAEQAADAAQRKPWRIASVRGSGWAPPFNFEKCRYKNCVYDETVTPETDLVHVYGVNLNQGFPRPVRYGTQSWMFSVWESPHHTHADFLSNEKSAWNQVFNLTMSYRVDSDVFVPYGRLGFEPIPLDKRANYYEIAKGKTKSVAWFVSNCRTPSRRYDYVQELKRYIDVDIYGGCGIPCKKKDGKCTKELPVKYKFYLSFENSICTDYISEKLYKIYAADMHVIPVTRGGSQYRRYFPENTFIDTAEFRSPRELAEYLKNLGSDLKRYSQMLEYKDQYRWFGGLDSMWCSLCETLSTKGLNPKTYNMKHWFGDGHCSQARDLGR